MSPPSGRRLARLPFSLVLALRYLKSTRRNSFVSFLSATAAGGMALGVAALVLALAALSGFQTVLRREILSRTPEIEIRVDGRALADELQESIARTEGVQRTQLTMSGIGWLVLEDRVLPVSAAEGFMNNAG